MINALLNGLLSFISSLISVVLSPIDQIIVAYFPDVSNALSSVTAFFNVVGSVLGWIIDLSCIPSSVISIVVATLFFRYTLRYLVYGIKLALNWYRKLMP